MRKQFAIAICCVLALLGCASNTPASLSATRNGSSEERIGPDEAKVIARLQKVGYERKEAIARVDRMSTDEIAYFSKHPESIKRTGIIILGGLISSSIWSSTETKKRKEEEERIDRKLQTLEQREADFQMQRETDLNRRIDELESENSGDDTQ